MSRRGCLQGRREFKILHPLWACSLDAGGGQGRAAGNSDNFSKAVSNAASHSSPAMGAWRQGWGRPTNRIGKLFPVLPSPVSKCAGTAHLRAVQSPKGCSTAPRGQWIHGLSHLSKLNEASSAASSSVVGLCGTSSYSATFSRTSYPALSSSHSADISASPLARVLRSRDKSGHPRYQPHSPLGRSGS